MDWNDRLDAWDVELELAAALEDSAWVTLDRASAETGVSRAALRLWYRDGTIASRLVDGPHGPQRLVPLASVQARAADSPRLRKKQAAATGRDELAARVEALERRVADLEAGAAQRAAEAAGTTRAGSSDAGTGRPNR